jgi:tetratricopeptide (TPR) repeat protein
MYAQMHVVELNLIKCDDVGTRAAIKTLMTRFSGSPYLPEAICSITELSRKLNRYDKLDAFYQFSLDTAGQGEYTLWPLVGKAVTAVGSGNDAKVTEIITQLSTQFSSHPYIANALSLIGEEYYIKAFDLDGKGQTAAARECLQKAIPIWEKVVNEHPASGVEPQVCCWLGDSYERMGNFQKSNGYFQKIVDSYPAHEMVWNALLKIGRNYEALLKTGILSKSEAEPKIRAAYQQIIDKYPDCAAVNYARKWLSRNSK